MGPRSSRVPLNHLVFADDTALFVTSVTGMNKLLREFEKGFLLAGLRANPAKSASIQIVINWKCKAAVSGIEPFACMNRELVCILDTRRNQKYLELNSSLWIENQMRSRRFRTGASSSPRPAEAATEDIFPSWEGGITQVPVEKAGQVVQEEC